MGVDLDDRSRDGSLMGGGSAVGSVVGGLSVASSSERGGHQRGNGHGRDGGASHGRKWEEPTTPLECIDLGDPIHRWEKSTKPDLEFLATTATHSILKSLPQLLLIQGA